MMKEVQNIENLFNWQCDLMENIILKKLEQARSIFINNKNIRLKNNLYKMVFLSAYRQGLIKNYKRQLGCDKFFTYEIVLKSNEKVRFKILK